MHNWELKDFKSVLKTLLADIDDCDLIGWDGEFTGISNDGYKISPLDTVEERYHKLRQGNMSYFMLQVGLCLFRKQESSYTAKPFNFYVLPRPLSRHTGGPQFVVQTSCMDFLATHGFDFNKVFRDGITFMKLAEEGTLKDKIMESPDKIFASPHTAVPVSNIKDEDKKFIDGIRKDIEKYLADSENREPLKLEPCSAFRRKLTYQQFNKEFADEVKLTAAGTSARYIQVTKLDKSLSKDENESRHRQQQLEELDNLIGFSLVIRKLSQSGKLIVGHNMLLDLMYVIHQFVDDLPSSYKEFKDIVKELFPRLIDTKTMSSTSIFKDSIPFNSLDEMISQLEGNSAKNRFKQVPIEIPEGFPDYNKACGEKTSRQFHDAAYDAYVTGKSFLIMINHVASKANPPITQLTSDNRLLSPFLGKLHLHRVLDVPYINLYGEEVRPTRENVFHLTVPKVWNKSDLYQLFSPHTIQIYWQNDTEVLVSTNYRNESDLKKIKRLVMTHISQSAKVLSYNDWHARRTKALENKCSTDDVEAPVEVQIVDSRKHSARCSEDGVPNKRKRTTLTEESSIPDVTPRRNSNSSELVSKMTDDDEKTSEKMFDEESWT